MHQQIAFLRNNVVANVAIVDDALNPAALWPTETTRVITPPAGIGWTWDAATSSYVAPPAEPEPDEEP